MDEDQKREYHPPLDFKTVLPMVITLNAECLASEASLMYLLSFTSKETKAASGMSQLFSKPVLPFAKRPTNDDKILEINLDQLLSRNSIFKRTHWFKFIIKACDLVEHNLDICYRKDPVSLKLQKKLDQLHQLILSAPLKGFKMNSVSSEDRGLAQERLTLYLNTLIFKLASLANNTKIVTKKGDVINSPGALFKYFVTPQVSEASFSRSLKTFIFSEP